MTRSVSHRIQFFGFVLVCLVQTPSWGDGTDPYEIKIRQVVRSLDSSVVTIESTGGYGVGSGSLFSPGKNGRKRSGFRPAIDSSTTGLVVESNGWIITNLLFLKTRPKILTVILANGKEYVAKVVGRDHHRGLALLHIDAEGLNMPPAALSTQMRVGAWAIALGRTEALKPPSVHLGILSATGRSEGLAIQCDASTSPLNYGGPLADLHGRVLGVLVPLDPRGRSDGVNLYDSGIGFAIPFTDIIERIPRLKTTPDLYRGSLGISLDKDPSAPAIVRKIAKDSAAQKAGLTPGDPVRKVQDVDITTTLSLRRALRRHYAGDLLRIEVLREGTSKTIEVTLDRWHPPPAAKPTLTHPTQPKEK